MPAAFCSIDRIRRLRCVCVCVCTDVCLRLRRGEVKVVKVNKRTTKFDFILVFFWLFFFARNDCISAAAGVPSVALAVSPRLSSSAPARRDSFGSDQNVNVIVPNPSTSPFLPPPLQNTSTIKKRGRRSWKVASCSGLIDGLGQTSAR